MPPRAKAKAKLTKLTTAERNMPVRSVANDSPQFPFPRMRASPVVTGGVRDGVVQLSRGILPLIDPESDHLSFLGRRFWDSAKAINVDDGLTHDVFEMIMKDGPFISGYVLALDQLPVEVYSVDELHDDNDAYLEITQSCCPWTPAPWTHPRVPRELAFKWMQRMDEDEWLFLASMGLFQVAGSGDHQQLRFDPIMAPHLHLAERSALHLRGADIYFLTTVIDCGRLHSRFASGIPGVTKPRWSSQFKLRHSECGNGVQGYIKSMCEDCKRDSKSFYSQNSDLDEFTMLWENEMSLEFDNISTAYGSELEHAPWYRVMKLDVSNLDEHDVANVMDKLVQVLETRYVVRSHLDEKKGNNLMDKIVQPRVTDLPWESGVYNSAIPVHHHFMHQKFKELESENRVTFVTFKVGASLE